MYKKHFEMFSRRSSGRYAATLLRMHVLTPEQIFAIVLAEVMFALPTLLDGSRYSTEALCDPAIWFTWSLAERRVAGMCLAYLVRNRVVQLFRHQTPSGKGKALYRTQPMPQTCGRITTKTVRVQSSGFVLQLVR